MAAATVSTSIFTKCTPAFGTDIKQCGSVTICDVKTATKDELATIFMTGGNYRAMSALLLQDFEIKACQTIQNGLYDFIMANKVDMGKRMTKIDLGSGRYMIMPFIQALQKSRINNEYWTVSNGEAGNASGGHTVDGTVGGASQWYVKVHSQTGMPPDARYFNTRMRVYIDGRSSGGSAIRTAFSVSAAATSGAFVELLLDSQNSNSNLPAAKVPTSTATYPTTGILVRGTPNVNGYENWCEEGPGLNTNKLVPFWIEEVRNSLCTSDLYEKYRDMIIDDNLYYKQFADVPEVEKNAQLGADWQRRFVNSFFWNKALANQDMNNYRSLEQISTGSSNALALTDEAVCVGYRANAIGVYEQLAECGQVKDLQGQVLNLQELFKALYNIQRIREANNQPSDQIDAFTDSEYASKIQQGMINYFDLKSGGRTRFNFDISKPPTPGKFGFRFSSYMLDYPVLTLNIISHKYFDDRIAAATTVAANQAATVRSIWILDFSGIYPGIIGSDRVVNSSGDLKTRAAVDQSFFCTMKVPTRMQTLTSTTYTVVVECPQSSLILENISDDVPEHRGASTAGGDTYGTDLYGSYS